jgi:hypothetical protein
MTIIVALNTGPRTTRAFEFLKAAGFRRVRNLMARGALGGANRPVATGVFTHHFTPERRSVT